MLDRTKVTARGELMPRLALDGDPASAQRGANGGARLLRANKRGWPRWAVHQMIVRRIRSAFAAVRVQGLAQLRQALTGDPSGVLLFANHSAWWDLFLAHFLNTKVPVDGYGMMEHFNLRRFGFFRRIGAFSIDRTDAVAVRQSLAYVVELLKRPRAGVWIMPQGRIAANDARPLAFQPGLRALLRRAGRMRVAPVAIRYEFWSDERPCAFARFGAPRWVEREQCGSIVRDAEQWLGAELDALRVDVLSQDAARFEEVLRGGVSINERYGRLRARLFGKTPGAPDDY
jgi:1-acyl-sn-glycerol-3-phosphate acyltransferase